MMRVQHDYRTRLGGRLGGRLWGRLRDRLPAITPTHGGPET